MLFAYAKNVQGDLTPAQVRKLAQFVLHWTGSRLAIGI